MKVSEIIKENPSILLVLEHFGLGDGLHDKTISGICSQNEIEEELFIIICNLYNGFNLGDTSKLKSSSIPVIIKYLNNSHLYYLKEKYPEIIEFIKRLDVSGQLREIKLLEAFFNEYFAEVREHLDYEENIAFPYFSRLLDKKHRTEGKKFKAANYLKHHSDIEYKLADLKNLLLQHLQIKNQAMVKRRLLYSLFELEYDLKIHSLIEEQILIPLVLSIEDQHKI